MGKLIDTGMLAMPADLRKFAIQNVKSSSPYNGYASGSYYTELGKSWDYTPPNTIRISDHWNFYSQGEIHCKTIQPIQNGKWAIGRYDNNLNMYDIQSVHDKDMTELSKHEDRRCQKQFIDNLVVASRDRMSKVWSLRRDRESQERSNNIKNKKIMVSFYHRVWKRGGRGHYNLIGEEFIQGILTWESKGGAWIIVNGVQYRQTTNYKEVIINN